MTPGKRNQRRAKTEDPLQLVLGAAVAEAFAGKLATEITEGTEKQEALDAERSEERAADGDAVAPGFSGLSVPVSDFPAPGFDHSLPTDPLSRFAPAPATESPDFPVSPDETSPSADVSPLTNLLSSPAPAPCPATSPSDLPPLPNPQSPFHNPQSQEPLPARMLNEYVYCARLFYYEQVEGVFVHNADTLRGSANHLRVDRGTSGLPAAEGSAAEAAEQVETIHAHSVSLGSERLGVTAKLDLVESRYEARDDLPDLNGDTADSAAEEEDDFLALRTCPVEYKNGAPCEGEDGNEIWPADRMQLGVQMLLLRENGYRCEQGILYYRGSRQRIALDYSPALEEWILQQIAGARRTLDGPIPPPLIDSPKCPRCSLVTVCLPDETRWLAEEEDEKRLALERKEGTCVSRGLRLRGLAPKDERRVLYLNSPGLHVGRAQEVLQVRDKKTLVQEVRLSDVSHVALFGNIQISTQTLQVLCEQDVPVSYFSMSGWFYGITRGHSLTNVLLRIEQFRLARDPAFCLRLAREWIRGKIRNHRTLLMRNHLEPPENAIQRLKVAQSDLDRAMSLDELLGMEGAAAAVYFRHFGGLIKAAEDVDPAAPTVVGQRHFNFDFEGRNRRPPTDPVNALLSLAYSLLAKDCTIAALAVGFDPYVGFYHQPRLGRPALALDLMEEFRPLIAESAVITAINNRMVTPRDFVSAGRAVNLTAAGRKHFFDAYEKRMNNTIEHPVFGYKVSYRRALELQFRILARALTGEIPSYVPFYTR